MGKKRPTRQSRAGKQRSIAAWSSSRNVFISFVGVAIIAGVAVFVIQRVATINAPESTDAKSRRPIAEGNVLDPAVTGTGRSASIGNAKESRKEPADTATVVLSNDENEISPTFPIGAGLLDQIKEPKSAQDLALMRRHYDETVWRDEVAAQFYEQTFVDLWDALLFQPNKFEVLKSFTFETLVIGNELHSEELDWGITVSQFADSGRIITADEWPELLDQFESEGFRIVETEWHHQKFEPAANSDSANSMVSFLLHIEHSPTVRRFIVKGMLKVNWANPPTHVPDPGSPSGKRLARAVPGRIEVIDAKILQRRGIPSFREQFVREFELDPSGREAQTTIHPVILNDLNNDGLCEVIVGGYNLVYWNRGNWQFDEQPLCRVPAPLGSRDRLHPNAGVIGDFDGDGSQDYLCAEKNGLPLLYIGWPGGEFPDPPRVLDFTSEILPLPTGITAGDIDGDGDLDVFIGQQKPGYQTGDIPTPYYDATDSFPSYLLLNDGHGRFEDVTAESGLGAKSQRRNFSTTFVDLDDDGDLDLMMTSDFSGADIFYNDGKGKFTDVTEIMEPRGYAFGMSHTFGDYNLDGNLDFLVIGMSSTTARRLEQMNLGRKEFPDYNQARMQMGYGNRMYLRDGDRFMQAAFNAGVARTGWSWGSTTGDFDGDGDQDVYIANGQTSGKTTKDYCTRFWCHDLYYKQGERPVEAIQEFFQNLAPLFSGNSISWNGYEHNALLMNIGGKDFVNVGYLMGVAFEFDSRTAVSGDLDGDGRVDLIVEHDDPRNGKSILHFVRNEWEHANHWIGVHLDSTRRNVSPLGAKATITLSGGKKLLQHNLSGHSVWAQHANTVHFGLGQESNVEQLEIVWIDGSISTLSNPAVDQYHFVAPPIANGE